MGTFIQVDPEASNLRAYYATAKGGHGPGVLLCHAWWGLNAFFTGLADRLAAEGYTVLAPDLYNGRIGTTIPEAEALGTALEQDGGEKAIALEQVALDYLLTRPDITGSTIAVIGFSMGANYATWLAALRPEIAAVIVFYGASDWNADYDKNATAPLQCHWASDDQFEASKDSVQTFEAKMKAAGHTPDFYTYPNTQHWFFESDRPEYNPAAAQLAWERTLAFLRAHCGSV
jgi:carboxymethylenebutenolidase